MASDQRKAARGASAAARSTAARKAAARRAEAKAAKERAEATLPHEEELQITLGHRERIDSEFVQLQQQKARIDARMEELRLLAQQTVGREQVLRELRGEQPPLPPVALMAQEPQVSENGDGPPAAEGEGEESG